MKSVYKILLLSFFFLLSYEAYSQRGLNVQNRINSKVQTRVKGKVNSTAFRAAPLKKKEQIPVPAVVKTKPIIKLEPEQKKSRKKH